MIVNKPPLQTSTEYNFDNLYSIEACSVAVAFCIYDKKRKNIVLKGTSRACGDNFSKKSVHAEEICINYCRKYDKRNKYEIYIWRYSKCGDIKPVYCCSACCRLSKKYNYYDKIFTFENGQIISASGKPYMTIGYIMINGL